MTQISVRCDKCGQWRSKNHVCPKDQATTTERELYLRKEVQRLQHALSESAVNVGFQQELLDVIQGSISALDPLPAQSYVAGHTADADIYAVLKLSDWHIGQQISSAATEGFGEFNWTIAQASIQYMTQKFLGWIETHRRSFTIPKLYILSEGDMISGDIHDELRTTNEFPTPVQSVKAGTLLAQAVATLAPHFPEVNLCEVNMDNHSRLTKKLQFASGAENSWGYVVHAVANALLSHHTNVNVVQAAGIRHIVDINGIKFLSEHGHECKAWMGIPYYGIERQRGKEASKRIQAMLEQERNEFVRFQDNIGFDFMSIGHWHVPGIVSGNILINGCLPGTTEYDHAFGRYAPPSQVSFLVHPRYKVFDWTAWQPRQKRS